MTVEIDVTATYSADGSMIAIVFTKLDGTPLTSKELADSMKDSADMIANGEGFVRN